jgi:hypothetical protein
LIMMLLSVISYPYGGTVNFQINDHRCHHHHRYSHHLDHHDHDHAHDHRDHHQFHEISYPYGGTVNFQICPNEQLTIHPPPMLNSSQTSAWCHQYIGRGNGKTEIPLLDSERISDD